MSHSVFCIFYACTHFSWSSPTLLRHCLWCICVAVVLSAFECFVWLIVFSLPFSLFLLISAFSLFLTLCFLSPFSFLLSPVHFFIHLFICLFASVCRVRPGTKQAQELLTKIFDMTEIHTGLLKSTLFTVYTVYTFVYFWFQEACMVNIEMHRNEFHF